MTKQGCDVVNPGCLEPPGLQVSWARCQCFCCGMPVCANHSCSSRVKWYGFGLRRVCARCQEDALR